MRFDFLVSAFVSSGRASTTYKLQIPVVYVRRAQKVRHCAKRSSGVFVITCITPLPHQQHLAES